MKLVRDKTKVITWLVLWLAAWGVALWLWGAEPISAPQSGLTYFVFVVAIALAVLLFPRELKEWLSRVSSLQIALMLAGSALFSFFSSSPIEVDFLRSLHIGFQQIMIAVLIFLVPVSNAGFASALWRVVVLFVGSHLLLFFFYSATWVLFFTAFSLIGAVLFVFLIQKVRGGVALSYLLHWGFYFSLLQLL